MEAIPRESAAAIGQKVSLKYLPVGLKDAFKPVNLLSRLSLRKPALRLYMNHNTYLRHKPIRKSQIRVFVTHFDESQLISERDVKKLLKVDKFCVQNRAIKLELIKLGIIKNRIQVVYGAVSNKDFYPAKNFSEVAENQILIVGDCKPRKNPKLIEAAVRTNQDFNFVIHGKNWEQFTTFSQSPATNVKFLEFDSLNHPELMRDSAGLLSLATNEGGPFPILEALASGTPVIATATGFAPDLINPRKGILLPLGPTLNEITIALQACREMKKLSWAKDMTHGKLSWEVLGAKLYK